MNPELVDEVPSRLRAKNWDSVALLNKPTKLNQILKFLMVEDFLGYESIDIETLTENLLIHQRNLKETNGINPFSNKEEEGYVFWFPRIQAIQTGLRDQMSHIATYAVLGFFCMIFPMARIAEFLKGCLNDNTYDKTEAIKMKDYMSTVIFPFYKANLEWCMDPAFYKTIKYGDIANLKLPEFV